jgi:hypothetical protein
MDERNQAYAVAFDEGPIEAGYGAANERLHAEIIQFPGTIKERVVVEVLMMPTGDALASYVDHEQLLGQIRNRRYPAFPDGDCDLHGTFLSAGKKGSKERAVQRITILGHMQIKYLEIGLKQ